jgi:amino acid transporter
MSFLPDTSEKINSLHKRVKDLLKQGKSEDHIINQLTSHGIEPSYARMILNNVYNDRSDRKNFWKLLSGGVFFIAGGIAINYFSYKISGNFNSGYFYLFWGILVLGVILIIKAFTIFRK